MPITRVAPLPETSKGDQIAANADANDTGEVFFDQDQW
jgi:hypothetical protein